jgi:sialate O-acetylesterase
MTLSLPNTEWRLLTDIGNSTDIHPKNKQDVGKRLAAIALHKITKKILCTVGPMYKSMKVEGSKINTILQILAAFNSKEWRTKRF